MFSSVSLPELLLIMVIVLLLFGSRRLPELARSLGIAISEFKRELRSEPPEKEHYRVSVEATEPTERVPEPGQRVL
ncbi:MAG TPA: twin-arginine translocase TatA/TatE family subunit [Blastocatellia bacterium]|nr:twin-arginine translocase TatA/TatE family subunit [Blastocatellia bacterium]